MKVERRQMPLGHHKHSTHEMQDNLGASIAARARHVASLMLSAGFAGSAEMVEMDFSDAARD
jgi:hypothetical protein